MTLVRRTRAIGALVLGMTVVTAGAHGASAGSGRRLFVASGVEHGGDAAMPDGTVTLPVHRGTSHGETVWFVVLDASDQDVARDMGANEPQKLANAAGTDAVQHATWKNGVLDFPGTVDFAPERQVTAGPGGFPPASAQPGAVGDDAYSPLVELSDGTVLNAPQIANATGRADKVVDLDVAHGVVTLAETTGFSNGRLVHYVSTDSSNPVAAALENATYAPKLASAPSVGDDSTHSARASLAAFVNGQTGASNPERQGLNSALLDGLSPHNVLRWTPNQGRYSPLWDVHLAKWSDDRAAAGDNTAQMDFGHIQNRADHGEITAPDGSQFAASGFIVDCPIISSGE